MKLIETPITEKASFKNKKIILLDTTLRDGSYAIDFKFSVDETKKIASALENAGVKQIEIGHGWGLNAESAGLGKALHTDQEYISAARSVLSKAIFGCFFIPGVARAGDLLIARDLGMDFVRIGNNITEYEAQENYIRIAKNLGFHVSSNLLKTYVMTPSQFAERAKNVAEMGADVVVCVDSAGGMTPHEVREYISAAKSKTNVNLGFHGHNNLGLANANALAAVEAGATVIDTTLQGIGRSAGNVITESFALLLEKEGYMTGVDAFALFEIGERYIRPYLKPNGGFDSVEFVLGFSKFHSSFVPIIKEIASEHGIDYRKLIIEVANVDNVRPTRELIQEIAKKISSSPPIIMQANRIENEDLIQKYA